jgi:hypothetical protein
MNELAEHPEILAVRAANERQDEEILLLMQCVRLLSLRQEALEPITAAMDGLLAQRERGKRPMNM